jgi:hypothetical protein
LLLRHQATHSLAPLVKSHSLTWFGAALIERGGVNHYIAFHLPPKGLEGLEDIGGEALDAVPIESGVDGLVGSTAKAVKRLAAADGHTIAVDEPSTSDGSGGWLVARVIIGVVGAVLFVALIAGGFLLQRRRAPAQEAAPARSASPKSKPATQCVRPSETPEETSLAAYAATWGAKTEQGGDPEHYQERGAVGDRRESLVEPEHRIASV